MKKAEDKKNKAIYYYTLENNNKVKITLMNYGATVTSIMIPDKNGEIDEIALCYDDVAGFKKGKAYFGATVGRYANRINNGRFELNGKIYQLATNDGSCHLHGGNVGFDKVIWKEENTTQNSVSLSYYSSDGEEGFPGNLNTTVTFSLDDENNFIINYTAKSDKDTIINLTNHTYFNLAGHESGSVENQVMQINADRFTEIDEDGSTNGIIMDVAGTPLDFRTPVALGTHMHDDFNQLKYAQGYDHNFIINGSGYRYAAKAMDEASGRTLDVYTDMPCMQLYCGNFLEGEKGKDGAIYNKYNAFCLETQFAPNSPNQKNFKSPLLKKGEVFDATTCYKFGIE